MCFFLIDWTMSDLEQTQAIYLEDYDEETDEENTDGEKKIVSFLKVLKQEGFPEKLFPLYEGDNVIGRQEDVCNIAIPLKALSRQHACIEIRGENHLIYDKGSRNKTRKGKLFLTPQVRYELKDKENLLFGDVKCVYIIGEHDNPEDSETGSESGFQTAPGDPVDNQMTTSRVTTLVYESEEEEYESDGSVDLLQPTQAYIQKQDGNKKSRINFDLDTDEDENRKSPDITVKETPAPRKTKGILSTAVVLPESGSETEEEKSPHSGKGGQMRTVSDMSLLQAPTQRFFAESDAETTEEDSPKKSILCAETQSFLEEKRGKGSGLQGVVLDNDNEEKDEDIPVVEVEEEEENEEEETDMSHLFANPTLASDLPDDVKDTEEDEDTVTKEGDQETETQVFTDQTVAVGDQTVAISDQTVAVSDETVAVSDETVAISEETLVKNKGRAKGGKKYGRNAKCAPVVEVEVNEDDATQKISEITDAATLAVCDQVECEATQVFDSKMKEAETVAIECEATQVLNEKSAEAETVVLECEATQVFDAKTPEAETVVLECEIGDEKITEAETVAVECEATQVFDDNKAAEAETVAMDEATQVFNDKLSEDEKGDSDSTQVLDEKISDAETVSGECEATQVFDNEECNIVKERGNSTAETVALECDPTQVFDEGTDSGPSKSTTVRSDRNTEAETDDHSEITQGIEEVQVVRKRGRGRGKKSAAESEPKSEVTVDSEEIQPKRSGRISKRKSLIVEDKPVEKALDTTTRKGRGRRGKGSKNMADVTEESGGKGEEVTKEETVSDFTTEKTTTEVEEVDSRVDDTKSDTSVDGIAQTVPYTMVCDEEDLQPTQAYCMEEGDEGSTTPPISELLGVEVEDSTPVEPVKIIQEKPDVLPVPIPPSSPHKSALASPGRRSPSPKKVHFEKRESEVLLNEATGSKLKPAEEFPESRSTGRNRRSLPNLTKAAIPTQGKIKKLSLDPPSEAEIPSSAKGRGGTKTNKSGSKETQGVKDKQVKVIDVEETPPLEEMESESVITQKGDEKLNVEEESSQGSSGGRRGKRKSQQVKTESHSEEPTSSQSGEKMQNEGVERDMAKGKKGKRGSKSQEPVSQNSEQPEGSISQGRGRRKRRTVDNEVDQSLSDVKAVKSEGGKQESSDTADRAKNKEPTDSETHLSRGKKVEDHDIEERKTEESPVVKEMNKKTKGCKSSTKAETESVPTKRKGRGTKSDIHVSATSVSSEVEDVLEQPSGESIDKEMEMDNSETISKPGSRRSRKKEALSIISEETSNDSQELPSTSSHNTRTKKGASNTSEKGSKEIIDSVMSESKTKTKQKGRGKEKLEQDKDMVDESEVSDGDSDKKSKRKSVTKQVHDVKTEESQESFISAEPTRGRRRKAVTKQTDSQVTQDDSGSKRKSRGGGHSLTEKGGGESGSRDSSVSGQSEADNVKSSAKKGSNKKVKNDQDTPPGTSDTEMSSDSQDSNKPKGAPKRGRGRHSTAEKSKMEPPSTPQQGKKSAKTTDSPSAALRRKSVDPMKPKVMFTGVTDEQGQKVVKDLGGHLVDAVQECTHLVTDKVRRTVKFLCCLARGVPIVNPLWLDSCKSSGMFVDHVPFLIRDEAAERQYKFTLHLSLEKASEASLLSGYQIHVTKSVKPDPANMKDIITCSGAEYLTTLPKKAGEKVVIISCPEDKGMCEAAVKAGVTIVNAEFILTGILRQEIAIESYILFQDKKRSRDSSIGGPPSKKRR
ncbi:mediator of DNA damage checkpoint protein 1-like [Saccostrea echinata]|uniref:mediator of DNA damage checkpoint protein 1-like n=1 Tax=Saccostrea echinata TaxID=191078 RepID=UPI002A7FEA46|nr:mediator of DNA damage checkpoint protein 1-like [Saccostrea echinata]